MCGFVAVIGRSCEKSTIAKALGSIRHRGPDEYEVWQSKNQQVSFGHTRLSIIDIATGKQPLTNADESLIAVVNGEFYDYQGIRRDLEDDGYKFKTLSDSEIILGLYERYGTHCLKYLRGEFAFVLYDVKNRLVFAARDYFGVKPLFYVVRDHAIYFASEAKAFKELGLPLIIDEESFVQTLNFFALPNASLFSNVYQVEPAHFLIKSEFSPQPRLQSYWDFNYPKSDEPSQEMNEEASILGFREILKQSIGLRLKADVPVACYLSGGLDSCSILGIAQHLSPTPITSFTLTFEHADYDEAKQAQEMAAFVGSPFNPISISQDDIAHSMEDAVWHAERFIINGHGVAKYLLSKAVNKAGFKVVLTGEGSDEIFGGYAHFRQDQILFNQQISDNEKENLMAHLKKTNKVSTGIAIASERDLDQRSIAGQLGFVPSWIRGLSMNKHAILEILAKDTLQKYASRDFAPMALNMLDIANQSDGRDLLHRSLYLWSRLILPHYLLTVLGDRMEMAHSVEGRVPFLDHQLVDYVVKMPTQVKIKGLIEKYALREAAKPFITKTIYERQKHPFLAPPAFVAAKKNAMAQLIDDTLRGSALRNISFIDHNKVINILDMYENFSDEDKARYDLLFMSLTSACMIQKRLAS